MSLMRIDFATAQLRLNDDYENHNFNRCNFVLPTVSSNTGLKTKIPSAPKFSSFERGLVKLPDSGPKSISCHEPKKQHTNDSIMVVLPNTDLKSDFQKRDLEFQNFKSSWTFPLLSSDISSAFLSTQMKPTENPFPQITNDRTKVQSSANYFMTRTPPRLPWTREEGGGEQYQEVLERIQPTRFYVNYGQPIKIKTRQNDEVQDVPQVGFPRDSKEQETFETISEGSFDSESDDSAQELEMWSKPHTNYKASCEEKTCNVNTHGQLRNSTRSSSGNQRRKDQPVSFATPLCVNICTCSNQNTGSVFGFSDSRPTSILTNHPVSEDSSISSISESIRDRRGHGDSSGSDCDNESTTSGYCLLRAVVSSRTLLRKRREAKFQKISNTPPKPKPVNLEPPVSLLNSITKSSVGTDTAQVVNACSCTVLQSDDTMQCPPFPRLTVRDKVTWWLKDCEKSSTDLAVQSTSKTCHQPSIPKCTSRPTVGPLPENPAHTTATGICDEQDRLISGLVTVTFKVQDDKELRTYNFVKKLRKKSSKMGSAQTQTKSGHVMSTTNETLFRCYAPPKKLHNDKRVVKLLKTVDKPVKRPATAPIPSNYLTSLGGKGHQAPGEVKVKGQNTSTVLTKKVNMSTNTVPVETCAGRGIQTGTTSMSSPKKRPVTTREPLLVSPRSTFVWTRPTSQKIDKSSQIPETKSTFVQYSPFMYPKRTI